MDLGVPWRPRIPGFILYLFGHVTNSHVKMAKEAILFVCSLLIIAKPSTSDAFSDIFDDVSSCKEVCRNTYTPHTYEKVNITFHAYQVKWLFTSDYKIKLKSNNKKMWNLAIQICILTMVRTVRSNWHNSSTCSELHFFLLIKHSRRKTVSY